MIIGQVCNPDVVTVEVGSSVFDAARLMRERHVGDLVVVNDDGKGQVPVGIITDRDIVIAVVAKDVRGLEGLRVEEIAVRPLVTVDWTDTIDAAAERMRENGVRRLPVLDAEGKLCGILTLDDILSVLAEVQYDLVAVVLGQSRRERVLRP